jgi:hypothetical protein
MSAYFPVTMRWYSIADANRDDRNQKGIRRGGGLGFSPEDGKMMERRVEKRA